MKNLSTRLKQFISYPFAQLDKLKVEISKTKRVIDMGVGDPDLPPPKEIQGALVAALCDVKNHRYPSYSGEEFLLQSIARFFLNRYKIKLSVDENIIVLIGTKEGIFHLPMAVLNSGNIAAFTEPGYPVIKAGIVFANGEPYPLPLLEKNHFLPDLEQIKSNTKLVCINYPNNPTTKTMDQNFMEQFVELAHRYGFIIVNDAAYNEIYFDEAPYSILEVNGALDVAIEFHSLSKTFNMSGWRIGYAVGNSYVINALKIMKKNIDSGVFRAIQYAGKIALDNYWSLTDSIRDIYKKRILYFSDVLKKLDLEPFNDDATFYIWTKIPDSFENSFRFSEFLIAKAGIITMPGDAMGSSGKKYVRFSMTLPNADIELAASQLRKVIKK